MMPVATAPLYYRRDISLGRWLMVSSLTARRMVKKTTDVMVKTRRSSDAASAHRDHERKPA
jgi:hypothetical protein